MTDRPLIAILRGLTPPDAPPHERAHGVTPPGARPHEQARTPEVTP